jgi:excisionase family DNA binding protein
MTSRHSGIEPLAISVEECADALSLSRAKVYLLMDREGLPSVHFGKSRVVPVAQLRDWLNARVAAEREQLEAEKQRNAPMVVIKPTPPPVKVGNGTRRAK